MAEPTRTCIVTRRKAPPQELVRFVLAPDGYVTPDVKGALPGRGVWITAEAGQVAAAVERRLFPRAFKQAIKVRDDLAEQVADLLARRALDYLGLANGAGLVVAGFTKVETLIERGEAEILVEARDAADDGRRKLRHRFLAAGDEAVANKIVSCFTIEQLSLALGRANVVHAALIKGRLGEEFLAAARRYAAYTQADSGNGRSALAHDCD